MRDVCAEPRGLAPPSAAVPVSLPEPPRAMKHWIAKPALTPEQRRGWGLMIFCARATRGLRMTRRSKQTVLLARRAPTIKRWSLDARSEEQSPYSFWRNRGIRRPSPGLMARPGVPVGGRVRKRAQWKINQPPSLKRTSELGRKRRECPGALLARRTRTIGMCSFDARSKGQPWPLPKERY